MASSNFLRAVEALLLCAATDDGYVSCSFYTDRDRVFWFNKGDMIAVGKKGASPEVIAVEESGLFAAAHDMREPEFRRLSGPHDAVERLVAYFETCRTEDGRPYDVNEIRRSTETLEPLSKTGVSCDPLVLLKGMFKG